MNSRAQGELNGIRTELNNIIRELESIEIGVRQDFQGIGNDVCASRLGVIRGRLNQARNLLNNLDTQTLAPGFGGN
jgi:hypothetical protein